MYMNIDHTYVISLSCNHSQVIVPLTSVLVEFNSTYNLHTMHAWIIVNNRVLVSMVIPVDRSD